MYYANTMAEIYAKVLYSTNSCITSHSLAWCCFKTDTQCIPTESGKQTYCTFRIWMFLLIVSQCLRSALSPGRAVWALFPVWMEDQDTWWSLLTALCAYRILPCKEKQTGVCVWVCVSCLCRCGVCIYVGHRTDVLVTLTQRLRPEIYGCCLDGVKQQLCHSWSFHVDKMGLEQGFRSPKPLTSHVHLSAIGELHQRKEQLI